MDDDESIRTVAGLILRRAGYQLELASDGLEALRRFQEATQEKRLFDAVVLDLTMLRGNCVREVLSEMMGMDPMVKAIVCSGYCYDPMMTDYLSYGFKGRLVKPFGMDDLLRTVLDVMAMPRVGSSF